MGARHDHHSDIRGHVHTSAMIPLGRPASFRMLHQALRFLQPTERRRACSGLRGAGGWRARFKRRGPSRCVKGARLRPRSKARRVSWGSRKIPGEMVHLPRSCVASRPATGPEAVFSARPWEETAHLLRHYRPSRAYWLHRHPPGAQYRRAGGVESGNMDTSRRGRREGCAANDIFARDEFRDSQLHIEWSAPSPPQGDNQGGGNSGAQPIAQSFQTGWSGASGNSRGKAREH